MSHLGGDLGAGLGGGLGACGVQIPSNLLISSGCLGLSGLNLTDVGGGGGGLHGVGGRGPLLGIGGLVRGAGGGGGGELF